MLSNDKTKEYRRIGHSLKPTVIIGDAGLSEGVCQEIDRALRDHELIKIKMNAANREDKQVLAKEVCSRLNCEIVQLIGNIALLYRAPSGAPSKLSNILRYYAKS